jgi:hypothetical protein
MTEIILNAEIGYVNKENNRRGKPKCLAREEAKLKGETYYFNGKSCIHGHLAPRCSNLRVSVPSPGPTSSTESPATTPALSQIDSSVTSSYSQCCPRDFFGATSFIALIVAS